MKVNIFTNDSRPFDDSRKIRLVEALKAEGIEITEPDNADIIVSFGGDGTFLRAARKFGPLGHTLLGVNAGRLGYITAASADDFEAIAKALASGNFNVECRSMLKVDTSEDVGDAALVALNEVALLKRDSASMISSIVSLDGHDLATYVGDGLIISTPTGSTGYNLSVGGPILEPSAPIFVISPIAAHSLSLRPLVVADSSTISITTYSRSGSYLLSVDGESVTMPTESHISVGIAPFRLKVAYLPDYHFADVLRRKLLWGVDKR